MTKGVLPMAFRTKSCLLLALLAAGCGVANDVPPPPSTPAPAASADGGQYRLPAEPAGARGVLQVRKEAKDGEDVVVVGRVGGSAKPFVAGRASFTIVDPS